MVAAVLLRWVLGGPRLPREQCEKLASQLQDSNETLGQGSEILFTAQTRSLTTGSSWAVGGFRPSCVMSREGTFLGGGYSPHPLPTQAELHILPDGQVPGTAGRKGALYCEF